jgi:hypothetical protein
VVALIAIISFVSSQDSSQTTAVDVGGMLIPASDLTQQDFERIRDWGAITKTSLEAMNRQKLDFFLISKYPDQRAEIVNRYFRDKFVEGQTYALGENEKILLGYGQRGVQFFGDVKGPMTYIKDSAGERVSIGGVTVNLINSDSFANRIRDNVYGLDIKPIKIGMDKNGLFAWVSSLNAPDFKVREGVLSPFMDDDRSLTVLPGKSGVVKIDTDFGQNVFKSNERMVVSKVLLDTQRVDDEALKQLVRSKCEGETQCVAIVTWTPKAVYERKNDERVAVIGQKVAYQGRSYVAYASDGRGLYIVGKGPTTSSLVANLQK